MISQKKCGELIETRIKEGKELTKIFTRDLVVEQIHPVGTICLSTWLIESLKIFDYIGTDRIDHKMYNIFEANLKNITNLTINELEDLIFYLQDALEALDLETAQGIPI